MSGSVVPLARRRPQSPLKTQGKSEPFPFGFFHYAIAHSLLSPHTARSLVEGLLVCTSEDDLATWCKKNACPPELFTLMLDALDLILNRWDAIAKRNVSTPLPEALQVERDFFVLVALSRLEKTAFESEWLARISPRAAILHRGDLFFAHAVEEAGLLMGRGLYREALRRLTQEKERTQGLAPGLFWQLREGLIAGISNQASGHYDNAHQWLQTQSEILQAFPSRPLHLAWLRRRLSLFLERESYGEAEDAFEASRDALQEGDSPLLKALFLQEGIRLYLSTRRPDKAREAFQMQSEVLQQGNIARSFLSATEERCELALLDNKPEDAAKLIVEETWWAGRKSQFNAMCIAHFSLARALAAGGAHETALSTAEYALSLAEKYEFGRDRVRLLSFCSAQALRIGLHSTASKHLDRALNLSRAFSLDTHTLLLTIVHAAQSDAPTFENWHGLVFNSQGALQAEHLANTYGFSSFQQQCTTNSEGETVSFLAFLQDLATGRLAFFPKEALLLGTTPLAKTGSLSAFRVARLDRNKARDLVVLRLFRSGRKGVSLQELHAARWPRVAWQSDRHARAVHGWLSEARALLTSFGLRISARAGRYGIDGPWQLHSRVSARPLHSGVSPERIQTIIDFLGREGPSSGAAIARFLGVTRQTLAPLLVTLRQQKKVSFSAKGRHSCYWVETNGPP